MTTPRKKAIEIPKAGTVKPAGKHGFPFAFVDTNGDDDDERDVSKPVGYDEHGNAVYAPRGIRFRW